jgi:small GTP-binding protein
MIEKDTGAIVASTRFWKIDFGESDVVEFLHGYRDHQVTEGLSEDTPVFVGEHKVFHRLIGEDLVLMLVTDGRDEERVIKHKVREGASRMETALRGQSIGYVKDNLQDILGELIFTRFKISFVGSGGVGKSTLLRLLFGREPAPGGYVPTINVAVDSSETIQFGTFLVTIWDFAGQAVFQDLWAFYFQGTDVIFLITDSSFRNVMQTKSLLRNIKKEAPAVPLFIIANKQDLPESMQSDKIKRLLGAPTFQMVATDKTRREEFIRLMLEVAAKTVGVQLPDLPVSEMITVRRRTEEVDAVQTRIDATEGGYETVPYSEDQEDPVTSTTVATAVTETETASSIDTAVDAEAVSAASDPARILHLLLIVQREGMFESSYHLDYSTELIDVNAVTSLISALDSFSGIDGDSGGAASKTDALENIEHEDNIVMVEKSNHFVLALVVTNDNQEDEYRRTMASLLADVETMYSDIWANWDGNTTIFEPSVFTVLSKVPLKPVSLDYIVRSREAGRALPFENRDVGAAVVAVKSAIEGNETVGGLVRSLDLPRDHILGCLEVVVKFVDLCDGTKPLEDVVRSLKVSLPAMRFVVQKLVLDAVLEVVA